MRVNIETRAFDQTKRLAKALGVYPEQILGHLAGLWHKSQDAEIINAEQSDLFWWLDPDSRLEASQEEILEQLQKYGFIKPAGDLWEIAGNRKHVEKLQTLRENARQGGLATAKAKGRAKGEQTLKQKQGFALPNSMQCNSKQGNGHDAELLATQIWAAVAKPDARKSLPQICQIAVKSMGGWNNLGRKRSDEGPFVIRALAAQLKREIDA